MYRNLRVMMRPESPSQSQIQYSSRHVGLQSIDKTPSSTVGMCPEFYYAPWASTPEPRAELKNETISFLIFTASLADKIDMWPSPLAQ